MSPGRIFLGLVVLLLTLPLAQADIAGEVYRIPGNCPNTSGCTGGVADAGNLTGATLIGTFTAPNVDFYVGVGNLGDFLSFGSATTSGLDVGELGAPMSNCPGQNPGGSNCYSTAMVITGFGTFLPNTLYSLTHDDGALMYLGSTLVVNSPHPTSPDTDSFNLGATGYTGNFKIYYAATNGNPEQLTLSPNVATPDGGTTAWLLGLAMGAVGLVSRRMKG
jgi:hypothetical protein